MNGTGDSECSGQGHLDAKFPTPYESRRKYTAFTAVSGRLNVVQSLKEQTKLLVLGLVYT
jgi:hypothetical protein